MSEDSKAALENLVTVTRTMAIFELLAADAQGHSLADIARHLDVNKSIAVRILSTLEQANYIYKGNITQRYYLTFKISKIGMSVLIANRFMEQIQPRLRDLADSTGELVLLSVIERDGPRWIMAANGSAGRRLQVDPLIDNVLHSTATGKAWLATLTDQEIAKRIGEKLPAVTEFTVASLPELLEQMSQIRQQGFAISNQENEVGIKAVSVPIHSEIAGRERRCVGFVSITAPISRTTDADFERFRTELLRAADYIGDVWPPQEAMAENTTRMGSLLYVVS